MTTEEIPAATATSTTEPVLIAQNIRTTIHTALGDLNAVDGVSLTIDRGEIVGLVGESGSGKSVLGRTLMGLHTTGPTMTVTGQAFLLGRDTQALPPRELRAMWGKSVGMIFQDPMTALNPVKRIGVHLTETLRKHQRLSRTQARARAVELLGHVGIPDPRRRMDQYPYELSGGMRQRVVIAMALANEPALLIADEPTTALDVTVQRQILDLLERLREEMGMAILLISHNLGVVAGRADRVAVMYAGQVAELGSAATLFDSPRHHYTDALLRAIPGLYDPPHSVLEAIDGSPPDMVHPPHGCRFAPRCAAVQDDCRTSLPTLAPIQIEQPDQPERLVACLHPVAEGGNR